MNETITLSFWKSLKRLFFQEFFQPTLARRNCWQMTNYKKTMVYIGLQDIKNNGVSDWLKKEHMINCINNCMQFNRYLYLFLFLSNKYIKIQCDIY